jgi:hypothetical protein
VIGVFTDAGPRVTTCYMSKVIPLPPLVAQAALGECLATRSTIVVRGRRTQLRVQTPLHRGSDWLLARSTGVLVRGPHRLRVELELTRWSSQRTELGLRPVRWHWTTWPSDASLDAGLLVLSEVDRLLRDWADAPLRALVVETRRPGFTAMA